MAHTIVIFGASGDLTSRKLIPALYLLYRKGRLPEPTRIIGMSRTEYSHDRWRDELAATTQEFAADAFDRDAWRSFANSIFYQPGDLSEARDFEALEQGLREWEGGASCTRLYYLSTLPRLYPIAVEQLGKAKCADESCGPRRIVVEKPFGADLVTARELNATLHSVFQEEQIYRIDHYLGKETVQNLLVLRFANSIFEPIWNRNYIDHVQITVAEEVPVGNRGEYYDTSGILRDMFQNHLLQLLMITAMEAPARYNADQVRNEKVKVLQAIRSMDQTDICRNSIRGQYDGYRSEKGVAADSETATFAALKLNVDNWRWNGVPFYLRSGKAMSCRTTQIVIQFREPPYLLFGDRAQKSLDANRLVVQIQPAEGIQLHFHTKVPDAGMRLRLTDLEFSFRREFAAELPDAYQRLLLDALNGDASLFARSDEVELAWGIIDPIIAAWRSAAAPPAASYRGGEWGPESSTQWMERQGRKWFDVCPVLH